MKAFITGSRAYGKPLEDSDIDLVILCDEVTERKLMKLSETSPAIRFGRLNLVTCTSDEKFAAWKVATEKMTRSQDYYDKKAAKAEIERLEVAVGIVPSSPSG